eukprot:NODE_302_length_11399_cov_0.339115.p8 type:complete len:166 gc:universal NODE_302_length_11399_cov_0.339115:8692-9189(+)
MILIRIKRKLSEAMPNEYDYKNKKFKHCKTIAGLNIPNEFKGMAIQNVPNIPDQKQNSFLDLDIDISNLNFDDTYVYDYYMVEDDYINHPSSSNPSEIDYPEELDSHEEQSEDSEDSSFRSWSKEARFSNLSIRSDSSNVWTHDSESVVFDFNSSDYDEMNDLLY